MGRIDFSHNRKRNPANVIGVKLWQAFGLIVIHVDDQRHRAWRGDGRLQNTDAARLNLAQDRLWSGGHQPRPCPPQAGPVIRDQSGAKPYHLQRK